MLRSSQAPVLLLLHPQLSFGAKHPPANESGGGGGEGANGAATSWILDTTLHCSPWGGDTGLHWSGPLGRGQWIVPSNVYCSMQDAGITYVTRVHSPQGLRTQKSTWGTQIWGNWKKCALIP